MARWKERESLNKKIEEDEDGNPIEVYHKLNDLPTPEVFAKRNDSW